VRSRFPREDLAPGDLVDIAADNAPLGTGLVIDRHLVIREQYLVHFDDAGCWKQLWFWEWELRRCDH